jgi:DMSO/TMAO reductase YedYZ heme-binding membrane subunit
MGSLTAATASLGSAPLWFVTRSTGLIAFVLMTLATCFGVAATQRALASPSWPRFATQTLHRNISLIGMVLLVVHIVTTIMDSYVDVGWSSLVVPGTSAYRTVWVSLGTVAFDLLLLVVLTSLARLRMSPRLWRVVHWSSYVAWPLMLIHFLKTGTDTGTWGLLLAFAALVLVGGGVAVRVGSRDTPAPLRTIVRPKGGSR